MKLLEERSGRMYDPDEPWKLDDYLALPDDTRIEIVEGLSSMCCWRWKSFLRARRARTGG